MCWQILSISIDVYIIAGVVFCSSFFITDLKVWEEFGLQIVPYYQCKKANSS